MIKISDYIVNRLATKYNIKHVFMITGGGAMHLHNSFGTNKNIKYICNHHEQACSIAAEGYSRASGELSVVSITSGPGGLNTLTGVFGQWTDSIPILYLSGQVKRETLISYQPELQLRQLGDQETDIVTVVKSFTKYAQLITDPLSIKYHLDKAIDLATTGRPGPVWLDIPLDIQGMMVEERDLIDYFTEEIPYKIEDYKFNKLIELIENSKRPVIIAGHGIRISKSIDKFRTIINKLNIPIVTTFNGMDLIESDHDLYVGRIGTSGTRFGNFALQNSDLVISLGSRNNIRQISYAWKYYCRESIFVSVDIDDNELKKHTLNIDLAFNLDLGLFLSNLDKIIDKTYNFKEWLNWCKERVSRYPVVLDSYYKNEYINPYIFSKILSKLLDSESIVISGNGSACTTLFQASEIKPNQRYFWNSGCATMGYDLPAAIGASFATDKQVICLTGDGSIMMNIQELATIDYYKLPIKIFILNNGGYSSMRQTQNTFFNSKYTGVDEKTGVGIPSFKKLSSAYNISYVFIDKIELIDPIIKLILKSTSAFICEVLTPKDYIFSPKLLSKKCDDGKIISKPLEDLYPFLDREEFKTNMIIDTINESE